MIARSLKCQLVQALRDLKYMLEAPSQHEAVSKHLIDLLYIDDEKDPAIMIDAGFTTRRKLQLDLISDYTGYGGFNFSREKEQQKSKEFFSRFKMALFGGSSLIVPMLIMRLHPTLLTELVTASIFIFAVAIILAWYMQDAEKRDILAATGTYAAVLVVFVGTTSQG